jgi:hypothetical protein
MSLMRAAIALDPRQFGRGRTFLMELAERHRPTSAAMVDMKLFASTFCGGFLFVALYLS